MGGHLIGQTPTDKTETGDARIEVVFLAQTHVMKPDQSYFKLTGNRDALLKAHVLSPSGELVLAALAIVISGGETNAFTLKGPATLPKSLPCEPGVVRHRDEANFTTLIPARLVRKVKSDGVSHPIAHNVPVISVLVAMTVADADVNLIYPLIGPYRGNLIWTCDPRQAEDRELAQKIFSPKGGCDFTLKITQVEKERFYLLPTGAAEEGDSKKLRRLSTAAVNVRAGDGSVTAAELLHTPKADRSVAQSQRRGICEPSAHPQFHDKAIRPHCHMRPVFTRYRFRARRCVQTKHPFPVRRRLGVAARVLPGHAGHQNAHL